VSGWFNDNLGDSWAPHDRTITFRLVTAASVLSAVSVGRRLRRIDDRVRDLRT